MNRWHGVVVKLDEESSDNRRIELDALDVVAVRDLDLTADMDARTFERQPHGVIDRLEIHDGAVYGEGSVNLPPGTYPAAIRLTWGREGVRLEPSTTGDRDVLVITQAGVVGVVVGTSAVWPDCTVIVEAF